MVKPITIKVLRDAAWKHVYRYNGVTLAFTTYASDALPGVTVTHEVTLKPKRRKRTVYTINGQRTDSPTQAVRIYNEQARKESLGDRHAPAGSPKPTGRPDAGKGTGL